MEVGMIWVLFPSGFVLAAESGLHPPIHSLRLQRQSDRQAG